MLFVGAGASVPAPSNLPTFRELARRIADDSQHTYTPDDLEKPDEFLGRIDNGSVDVHLRVRDLIARQDSQPNELHRAIVELGGTSSALRIVTTNYDRHLSCFLPGGVDEFEAPALPPGNDFRGLVSLHGSIRQDPRRLVVTDSDFGHAYLSDGWALRFLAPLFGELAVLFIGYGLNDTLMQYLVKALSRDAEVYAFTDKPNDPRWAQHGVVPVDCGPHGQLPGLIRRWTERARMGMLDHDRRIAGIVAGIPPLSPEDESYLDGVVAHPEKVGLFARHARGAEWLRWVSSRPQFKALFDPWAPFGRTEHSLKMWFADHYAASEDLAGEALALVPRNGGLINRELWFWLVQSLSRSSETRSESTNRWIPVLVQTMPTGCNDWLGMLLSECELPRDHDFALLLLDRICEPRLAVDPLDPGRMGPRAGPEESWLQSAVEKWLGSNGVALARDLAPLLDRHLRQFFRLTETSGSPLEVVKLEGLGRTAIEGREHQWHVDGVDPLIDMARDVIEALVDDEPEVASGYLRVWSEHEWAILRRLAVHGWTHRQDVSNDDKLRWLGEAGLVMDSLLRPEVMRLLRASLPHASPDTVEALVEGICGERQNDERYAYILLDWIAKHAPQTATATSTASTAYAGLQASHPDWMPLEDPDFPSWSQPLPAKDLTEPVELKGLHDRIQADAEAAVAGLINERDERAGRGVDWTGARDALFSTVLQHSGDGIAVLEVLAREPTASPDLERALGETVLGAWGHAKDTESLTDEQCIRIGDLLPDMWRLGLRSWGDAKVNYNESGWLPSAESHWAGMIARLWLEALLAERRIAGDGWTGLPLEAKAAIGEMTGGDTKASHFAQVVVTTHLLLLFQLDEPWCLSNVLPMLDPSIDEHRAVRCWEGYLVRGRADEQLLRAGLLEHFVAMAALLERLARRQPRTRLSYAQMAASFCLDSSIHPVENGWLASFTASTSIEARVAWVQVMTERLSKMPTDAADAHWSKWMRRYWEDRLASIPVAMTAAEASAMAEWPVLLGDSFSEAAHLAIQVPAGLCARSRLLYRLAGLDTRRHEKPRPDHPIEHPELTARLLAHVLRNAEIPATDSRLRHLPEVVARLYKLLDDERMKPIVSELLRLGFGEFVGWLQSQRNAANDSTPAASLI